MTNQVKGYPFEVVVTGGIISGVVLADQVKSLDWRARDAEFHCVVPAQVLGEVIGKLKVLIEDDV
jgi:mRNA interferase MazF